MAKRKLDLSGLGNIPPVTMTIAVESIRCIEESNELDPSDEVYVLVTAVDLSHQVTVDTEVGIDASIGIPTVWTTRYGPWDSVDAGERHGTLVLPPGLPDSAQDLLERHAVVRTPFWGPDQAARVIERPEDVMFIVTVMDHDDDSITGKTSLVNSQATAAVMGALQEDRDVLRERLIDSIRGAAETPLGFPSRDDVIGIQELALTATDLRRPMLGRQRQTLTFRGDGAQVEVRFELVAA